MIKTAHTKFDFDLKLFRRGKVRDVFDFGDELLIVSSDRVSAFDEVIERGIPNKGGKFLLKLVSSGLTSLVCQII